jgi:hypothetical protein
MGKEVRDAVFGNVGSLVAFRVGVSDAAVLAKEFGSEYSAGHFTDLPNHEIRVKLLEHGESREPFLARTLPPSGSVHGHGRKLMKHSRQRFGARRDRVEARIRRWLRD